MAPRRKREARSYRAVVALTIAALFLGNGADADPIGIPSLFNPRLRLDAPPVRPGILRFVTTDDSPPFHFAAPDGSLAGFDIDLARALCQELRTACTIQSRRADLLAEALSSKGADAIVPAPPDLDVERFALSLPYLPRAGRFAQRAGSTSALTEATPKLLAGRTVGVVADTPHARYLARFFPDVTVRSFPTRGSLLDALGTGDVELVFADGGDLAFWLNGVTAANCCSLVPGPFLDRAFFGPGMSIAVRGGDDDLRRAIDAALAKLDSRGTIGELYLRYFPVPPL